ncbi:procathepsin L-like [Cydia strobilella]|uniref:procathepsin L-like n=1 Tax=Cydia strobilella TaxID=1100964 RepID=UPI00300558C7
MNTMFVPIVLAMVCLASSTVLAAYDKPYYDVEDAENLFKNFIQEHKKVYNRREYYERLEIFKETLREINERNDMFPDTVFAVNHFADLKPHEREQYHGLKLPSGNRTKAVLLDLPEATATELDWRKKDAVTDVKSQGQCGSCYIFSAVGAIEGQYAIKHKQCPVIRLTEGQALDCLNCGSCGGGVMHAVFQELAQKKKKLEKEADYPYEDSKKDCHEDQSKGVALVIDGKEVTIPNEEELKKLLSNYGPLAVGINAADLHHYAKGILEPDQCKGKKVDHGVVLVGYGEENGKQYWLIKNSWGTVWGEKGYVRLRRGVDACKMGTGYTATCNVE